VKGIILDLRNSPGGLLDSAAKVVTKIGGGGVIGKIQERGRTQVIKTAAVKRMKLPVVVLINSGTASVAELAAAYLHDVDGAAMIGATTFGDGMVQTPMLLKDGSAAVFSTGRMITTKGYSFDGKGIRPDKTVSKPDAQLDEARRALQAKIGRV
jgi:carboxyl-terminal processing protease